MYEKQLYCALSHREVQVIGTSVLQLRICVLVTSVSWPRCDASHDFQSVPSGDTRHGDTVPSRAGCLPDPSGRNGEVEARDAVGDPRGPTWTPGRRAPASGSSGADPPVTPPSPPKKCTQFSSLLAELAFFVYFHFIHFLYLFCFVYSTNKSMNSFYIVFFYSHHLSS